MRAGLASILVLAPYLRLVRAGYLRYAAYRQAMLAGLVTNVVFGLLRAAVLVAVIAQRGPVAGYDVATAVTYVWLGQGLLSTVALWSERELSNRIRTGDVVVDLGRPWDLAAALLAGDLGRAANAVLVRLLPPMVVGMVSFPFRWPAHAATWALFVLVTALAVVTSFGIRFLLNLSAFWLLDARGVLAVWGTAGGLLTGLVLPIAWFPAWAQAVLAWTPFPVLFQVPIDVFTERGDPLAHVARAAFWAVALFALGRIVLARGARRLVVQGG